MDQSCQKVLLVLTQATVQTYFSSSLANSFLSIKVSSLIALNLKQTVCFYVSQNMISMSALESCEASSGKKDFSSDISRNTNSTFPKTTAV